jgi:hypothetical protein
MNEIALAIQQIIKEEKAGVRKALAILNSFDWKAYHKHVGDSLADSLGLIVETQGARAAEQVGGTFTPDDPFVKKTFTDYVGDRIVDLDNTTKDDVATLIRDVLDDAEGLTTIELGDKIAELVQEKFAGYEDWRADRIARAETSIAYNHGTVFGYKQSGVSKVLVLDGDDFDDACREANGQIWTLAKALANPIEHPGCERGFSPVQDDAEDDE